MFFFVLNFDIVIMYRKFSSEDKENSIQNSNRGTRKYEGTEDLVWSAGKVTSFDDNDVEEAVNEQA